MSILKFIRNRSTISVMLSVVLAFAFIALATNASTTISTNINTDGTLTVAGAVSATSTSAFGGLATFDGGILSTASSTVGGVLVVTGAVDMATTSEQEALNVGGDAIFGSSATTTITIDSTTSEVGGCIQIRGTDDVLYRAYISATSTASDGIGAVWFIDAGLCQ